MTLINFDKFERAQRLLESSAPNDVSEQLLESNGLTREELEAVNEGFFTDLLGGWFKKLKTKMLRKIPGGVLKKVDKTVAKYQAEKLALLQKSLKEKEKIYKAEVGMQSDPGNEKKYQQIIDRADQALKAIKAAANAKIDRFNVELEQMAEDKSDMVADYINLKIAEVKEQVAVAELKEIEKFASEEQVEKTKKKAEEKKAERENLQKELDNAVKSAKDLAGADAKKGELWIIKNKSGDEVAVEILEEPGKGAAKAGEVRVKANTKKGTEYAAKIANLVKKVDEEKEKKKIDKVKNEEA